MIEDAGLVAAEQTLGLWIADMARVTREINARIESEDGVARVHCRAASPT